MTAPACVNGWPRAAPSPPSSFMPLHDVMWVCVWGVCGGHASVLLLGVRCLVVLAAARAQPLAVAPVTPAHGLRRCAATLNTNVRAQPGDVQLLCV